MGPTIYGNYSAPAISSRTHSGPWHIEGDTKGYALCGKFIYGDQSRMMLHVSLLECSICMQKGAYIYEEKEY